VSKIKTRSSVAVAALIAALTGFEGIRQTAYPDPATLGKPWTVCMGETKGVKPGDHYSLKECKAMLRERLVDYTTPVESCLPNLPDARFVAFVSLAWNIGATRTCQSTAAKFIRLGEIVKGCNAFMSWNKAAGIVFPGLTRRRAAERDMCLKGVL
jgi:lysozyme